jgi:hypothetical protein
MIPRFVRIVQNTFIKHFHRDIFTITSLIAPLQLYLHNTCARLPFTLLGIYSQGKGPGRMKSTTLPF